jgi:hypothetical protein
VRQAEREEWCKAHLTLVSVALVGGITVYAMGNDGSPYGQLTAVGGPAYLGAIAFMRWRG